MTSLTLDGSMWNKFWNKFQSRAVVTLGQSECLNPPKQTTSDHCACRAPQWHCGGGGWSKPLRSEPQAGNTVSDTTPPPSIVPCGTNLGTTFSRVGATWEQAGRKFSPTAGVPVLQ